MILNNRKMIIILFIVIFLFLCMNIPISIQVGLILIVLFFREDTYSMIEDSFLKSKKDKISYNTKLETIYKKLKKYKHISPYDYRKMNELWKKFVETIYKLENDKLYNYSQYFENALFYLKELINIIMNISTNANERRYIDSMDYNDFESSKELNEISRISKELYQEGHNILYNLSIRLNYKWSEDPNIHNKELVIDYPQPRDSRSKNYEYY